MNHETSYHLLCDESDGRSNYFSDFYGGVLVASSQIQRIESELQAKKTELNFYGEVKWQKVTERYFEKYAVLMTKFFDFLRAGEAKVRIMFRSNALVPTGLTPEKEEESYFILYYQFIKHAFGFIHRPAAAGEFHLHMWFDQFPDKVEKVERFKKFVVGLEQRTELKKAGLRVDPRHVTEVRSHDHALLQCLDVVLGAMAFRLNDKHLEKNPETGKRGKRTIAKENLYKHILREICTLKPNFNVGMSTGCVNWPTDRWEMPYRHWRFEPNESKFDPAQAKPGKKKHPTDPKKGPDA